MSDTLAVSSNQLGCSNAPVNAQENVQVGELTKFFEIPNQTFISGGFAGTGTVYTAESQLQAFQDSLNLTLVSNFTAVETL